MLALKRGALTLVHMVHWVGIIASEKGSTGEVLVLPAAPAVSWLVQSVETIPNCNCGACCEPGGRTVTCAPVGE